MIYKYVKYAPVSFAEAKRLIAEGKNNQLLTSMRSRKLAEAKVNNFSCVRNVLHGGNVAEAVLTSNQVRRNRMVRLLCALSSPVGLQVIQVHYLPYIAVLSLFWSLYLLVNYFPGTLV